MIRAADERIVMDADAVRRAVTRVGHEIRERDPGRGPLVLVGLRTRGIPLALRLQRHLQEFTGEPVVLGRLDPSLYRDDLAVARPRLEPTDIPVDLSARRVVLVDDVLFTGR